MHMYSNGSQYESSYLCNALASSQSKLESRCQTKTEQPDTQNTKQIREIECEYTRSTRTRPSTD